MRESGFLQHELGAREIFCHLAQPIPQRAPHDKASGGLPQLREHFPHDALRPIRIHQNAVRLGVQRSVMASFELDQGRRVAANDPLQQVGIGHRRPTRVGLGV